MGTDGAAGTDARPGEQGRERKERGVRPDLDILINEDRLGTDQCHPAKHQSGADAAPGLRIGRGELYPIVDAKGDGWIGEHGGDRPRIVTARALRDSHLHQVGEVILARRGAGLEPLERIARPGCLQNHHPAVDLCRPHPRLGDVVRPLDDANRPASRVPPDSSIASRIRQQARQHRDSCPRVERSVDQLRHRAGIEQRMIGIEDQDPAGVTNGCQRAADRVPSPAGRILHNDIDGHARTLSEVRRPCPNNKGNTRWPHRAPGCQHARHHRHAGDWVKGLGQCGAHARTVARSEDDERDGRVVIGRRQLPAADVRHAYVLDQRDVRRPIRLPWAARSLGRDERSKERAVINGWRARIRTWNKGSKDPCDTISPPATDRVPFRSCYAWAVEAVKEDPLHPPRPPLG